MKKKAYILGACFGLMLATVFTMVPRAGAALGGSADSVTTDRKALSAARRATTVGPGYTVQEIASDATNVREYVSRDGIVFAIAWNGLMHPDLTILLGSYVGEYQQAAQKTPRQMGQRRREVRGSRVVVEKWGHMRNLQGRAYVPALVPSGVPIDEIK
ncbi:DUF2844 domain-containing protein [Oryzomonas sagensis]|nr:DUF2844 domain-containing protein [Oryzomonas sagensis]